MGAGHHHNLYLHGTSPVHRLAPQVKLVATLAFVIAVVAAPREAFWVFGIAVAVEVVVARVSAVRIGLLVRRLVIEAPFVAFAVLLPVVGEGERTAVLGLSLSIEGLWAAWNILAKATIGLGATLLLTATTDIPDLLVALERLRLPAVMTGIAAFMIRYVDVLVDDVRRMRLARLSRGDDPRWLWQAGGMAAGAGTLFVRSFERGERVYLAMRSRGFEGTFPTSAAQPVRRGAWAAALLPAIVMATCTTMALVLW